MWGAADASLLAEVRASFDHDDSLRRGHCGPTHHAVLIWHASSAPLCGRPRARIPLPSRVSVSIRRAVCSSASEIRTTSGSGATSTLSETSETRKWLVPPSSGSYSPPVARAPLSRWLFSQHTAHACIASTFAVDARHCSTLMFWLPTSMLGALLAGPACPDLTEISSHILAAAAGDLEPHGSQADAEPHASSRRARIS